MNVEATLGELDLLPLQVADLRCPQTVAVGHKDHGRVAMAVAAMLPGAVHQPVDLALGEVSPLDCQVYDAWGAFLGCRFHADKPCPRVSYCMDYIHFLHWLAARPGTNISPRRCAFVSSGCIRLTRQDVIELYGHVSCGALAPR